MHLSGVTVPTLLLVKQEISEGVYGMVLQRLHDKAKGEFPESYCPAVQPHTRRDHVCYRRHREPPVRLSPAVRLARWAMRNERIEGQEWGAYVVLVRSSVTEHGMAYGPRGLRSRSANSSRGVTSHRGARESRVQGEVAQVVG